MTTYRVALIGTGRVGYQFNFSDLPDNHAEALCAHPRCEIVAGVNRGRDKLADFGQRFSKQNPCGVLCLHSRALVLSFGKRWQSFSKNMSSWVLMDLFLRAFTVGRLSCHVGRAGLRPALFQNNSMQGAN